jgi:hypothetical protein
VTRQSFIPLLASRAAVRCARETIEFKNAIGVGYAPRRA